MKTDVVQKAIVLNDQGQMLALRRSVTDRRRPLEWDLTGGELEDGEELREGVEREIKEESGLSVREARPIYAKSEVRTWEAEGQQHNSNVVFIFYVARATGDEVTISHEHAEYKWMTLAEALEEFEYPLHKEVFQYIVDNQLID